MVAEIVRSRLRRSEFHMNGPVPGHSDNLLACKPALHCKRETQPQKEDVFVALRAVAEISVLLLALAFVAGWSYMASYYTAFGLNPLELDFSVPATAAFALHVLRNSSWPLGLLATPLVFYPFSRKLGVMSRVAVGAFVAVLLFVVATVGSARGRELAREDMFETSPRLPTVGFVRKANFTEPSCLSDGTMDCKLLLHAKGTYYFFTPIRTEQGSTEASLSNLNVYAVPEDELFSVHVSPGCGTRNVNDFATEGCK